jgi:hypothetical protein
MGLDTALHCGFLKVLLQDRNVVSVLDTSQEVYLNKALDFRDA